MGIDLGRYLKKVIVIRLQNFNNRTVYKMEKGYYFDNLHFLVRLSKENKDGLN